MPPEATAFTTRSVRVRALTWSCSRASIMIARFLVGRTAMAQILVRNLDPKVVKRLKKRAREGGRSLQAEAKMILAAIAGRYPQICQTGESPQ